MTEAAARRALPTVITFDHHPDEVLRGTAPALLLDPQERLERLEAAGLAVTVVQHFDDALRRTPYDAFVERIRSRLTLTGFLMTPDAAFGFERRGTPVTLAALGARDGFEVVVVPPFTIDGHEVRSSEIRDRDRRRRPRGRGTAARTAGHDHGRDRRSGRRRFPARVPPACRPATRWRVRRACGRRAACPADQGRGRLPVRAGPRTVASRSSSEPPDASSLSRRRGSRAQRPGSSHPRQPGRRGPAPPRPVRRFGGGARDPPHDAHAARAWGSEAGVASSLSGDPVNQRLTLDKTDIRPRAPIAARRCRVRGSRSGP